MHRAARAATLVAVLIALGAPSAAQASVARVVLPPELTNYFDWGLAAGKFVYLDFAGDLPVVRAKTPAHPGRGLTRFDHFMAQTGFKDEGRPPDRNPTMAVSSRLIAVGMELTNTPLVGDDYTESGDLAVSVDGRSLVRLLRCRGRAVVPLAAAGLRVVYTSASCPDKRTTLAIADFSSGRLKTARLAPPAGFDFAAFHASLEESQGAALSGPYLAASANPAGAGRHGHLLIVYDLRSQKELYRVEAAEDLTAFALQADGKVAVVEPTADAGASPPDCGPFTLAWASPADPVLHQMGTNMCADVRPWMAHDTIVARHATVPGATIQTSNDASPTEMVALHIDSGAQTQLAHPAGDVHYFDGGRIGIQFPLCFGTELVLQDLASLSASPHSPGEPCVARLVGSRRVRVTAKRFVPVSLVCPRGCPGGLLRLRVAGTQRHLRFTNFYGANYYPFGESGRSAQARGLRFTLRPQLRAADAKAAARGLSVVLELQVNQPAGNVVKQQPIALKLVGSRQG
jgi:hypothetical protein